MEKVIAVSDNKFMLTTRETALKNRWYISYEATVVKTEEEPQPGWNERLPKTGTVMYGIGMHAYKISFLKPTLVCARCGKSNSANRIGKSWYCTTDFKTLTVTKPIVSTGTIPRRNEPCHCGSGKKYKHCCMPADRHEARHYFNSEYKREETNAK